MVLVNDGYVADPTLTSNRWPPARSGVVNDMMHCEGKHRGRESILQLEHLGWDAHTAQTGNHAAELDNGSNTLEDTHVRPADFTDKLELGVLWQVVETLDHAEDGDDNVDGRVSLVPQLVDDLEGRVDVAGLARLDHLADLDGVRLVADLEDVVLRDKAESGPCRLEVVDGLAHVALGSEDEGLQALVVVLDFFSGANLLQALQDLGVAQLAVPQDGATRLDGLDDLVAHVARERETGRVGVDLHGSPQRLLRAGRHPGECEQERS